MFLAVAFLLQTLTGFDFGITRLVSMLLLELPNSRTQEIEGVFFSNVKRGNTNVGNLADTIGMRLTAKACFDPEAAVA